MAGEAGEGAATPGGTGRPTSSPMFRGVTQLALDAKGRLAIPARHRDALAPAGGGRARADRRSVALPARCIRAPRGSRSRRG